MQFILTLTAILGGVGGFIAALPILKGWSQVLVRKDRLKVLRVTSETSEDLWDSFGRLHQKSFPDEEVADTAEDIRRWIDEWCDAKKSGPSVLDEMLFFAVINELVVGYVYAQYYADSKYVFISYIGSDRAYRPGANVTMPLLLERIYKTMQATHPDWKGIVGELEEFRTDVRKGRVRHAAFLFEKFIRTTKEMSLKKKIDLHFYAICADYWQPVLRPEDIPANGSVLRSKDLKQWIIYAPNGEGDIVMLPDGVAVAKEVAVEILTFIFLEVYRDTFKEKKYQDYLRASLEFHSKRLPLMVKLGRNHREAAGLPM